MLLNGNLNFIQPHLYIRHIGPHFSTHIEYMYCSSSWRETIKMVAFDLISYFCIIFKGSSNSLIAQEQNHLKHNSAVYSTRKSKIERRKEMRAFFFYWCLYIEKETVFITVTPGWFDTFLVLYVHVFLKTSKCISILTSHD